MITVDSNVFSLHHGAVRGRLPLQVIETSVESLVTGDTPLATELPVYYSSELRTELNLESVDLMQEVPVPEIKREVVAVSLNPSLGLSVLSVIVSQVCVC